VVTCIIALVNYFYVGVDSSRLTLTEDSDPNGFVGRLLISLFVAFKYLQVKHKSRSMYLLLYFAFGVMVFSIFLSGSRAGFLTVLIIGLIWISIVHKDNILRKMMFIFSIFLLILILSSFLPVDIFERITKIDSYTRDFASDYSRSYLWKSFFLKILPDSPILGFGSGTAGLLTLSYNGLYQGLHNTYLNIWLEYGLFGLPIFLYLIYLFFLRLKTRGLIAELGLLLGTLCIIFFLDAYPKKYLWNTLMYIGLILDFPNLYIKSSYPTKENMEIKRLNGVNI
jgi:O-antigen ligase